MAVKFIYRNFPDSLPLNPYLVSHTLENMKDNGLGEARTGKYLIMNKFAESETKPSRLDVDFNSLYTDIKNKLVREGFGQGGGSGEGLETHRRSSQESRMP